MRVRVCYLCKVINTHIGYIQTQHNTKGGIARKTHAHRCVITNTLAGQCKAAIQKRTKASSQVVNHADKQTNAHRVRQNAVFRGSPHRYILVSRLSAKSKGHASVGRLLWVCVLALDCSLAKGVSKEISACNEARFCRKPKQAVYFY